ncbi:hypothetical protein FQN57_002901 [Myotisia sp. PD_48]|nr:hypothetical protein FQN57_002901 [Myotisia sp. PD_48]
MADLTPTTNNTNTATPTGSHRGRGNRSHRGNRQRGNRSDVDAAPVPSNSLPPHPHQQQHRRGNPPRGRGSAGRGGSGGSTGLRGGRSGKKSSSGLEGRGEPPGINTRGTGTSGERLTGAAKCLQGEGDGAAAAPRQSDEEEEDIDDSDLCFICASKIDHVSTESPFVVFTNDRTKRFEDFAEADFTRSDENLGIKYDTFDIFEDTVLLLRYNCPDKDCEVACLGWPDLHRHVKTKHGKVMCDLCTRNKKVFTHEHELFTMTQLRKHEKHGDDQPGAVDQSGFKGHPECGFCRQRFYGDDELYAHCRDKHERCHICDRLSGGRNQQYYINYNSLEEHFSKDHFLCLDKECLEKKFIVFDSQLDLKAHQLESHPAGLSKDARRDARLVDMSTFDFRAPYQQPTPRRGAGRGRDPNLEPIPQSSAQPLRRDELAFQRQMAIQSAQSVSTRTFGGQLTQNAPQPARAQQTPISSTPQPRPTASPSMNNAEFPDIGSLEISSSTTPSTPQEQARLAAHTAVMDRASTLLRNDPLKINDFRSKVSAYRRSVINGTALIESFFSLFDTPSAELGKLIQQLAALYEDDSKRIELLKAWNDWRAINEDYPALPGPSGTSPMAPSGTVSGIGIGKRVLRLKSSTTPSPRSLAGQNSRLSGILPSSSTNPFPPLSGATKQKAKPSKVWGNTPTASPPTTSLPTSRSVSRAPTPGPKPRVAGDNEAFPALPAAPKPNTLMAGLTRGAVRWENQSRGVSAWGTDPTPAESREISQDNKGKGKKGKQVLYHFG